PVNWAEFGLQPPGTTIEVKAAGKTETLQISSKNAFDGSFYVRRGDELLLGGHGIAQIANRDPSSFRSKRLWRETSAKIESVNAEINSEKTHGKFSVVADGANYSLQPTP